MSKVANGTDWIETIAFGSDADRWRLDDYLIWMDLVATGSPTVLLSASLDDGRLQISDARNRRMEINIPWPEIEALGPGPFEYDFLFQNRTTGVRSRSERLTLQVGDGITEHPEA